MDKKYSLGIDLGGTKIASCLCLNGEIIKKVVVPTNAEKGTENIINTMIDAVKQAAEGYELTKIEGIGIGAAGQINPETGEVIYAPNLGWNHVPLGEKLEQELKLPVKVLNDVRAATVAEQKFGNGKGLANFANIFVGTGVGSGFVMNGRLLNGSTNSAGEIGHICLDPNGPVCGCGKHGCLEAYSSGTGMENYVKVQIKAGRETIIKDMINGDVKNVHGPLIGKAADKGDKLAIEAIERVGFYLGLTIANIHTLLNPDIVLLGGGMMALSKYFMPILEETMHKHILPVADKERKLIKEAKFTNDAVMLGGAAIFQ